MDLVTFGLGNLWAVGCRLWAVGCRLWAMGYGGGIQRHKDSNGKPKPKVLCYNISKPLCCQLVVTLLHLKSLILKAFRSKRTAKHPPPRGVSGGGKIWVAKCA